MQLKSARLPACCWGVGVGRGGGWFVEGRGWREEEGKEICIGEGVGGCAGEDGGNIELSEEIDLGKGSE